MQNNYQEKLNEFELDFSFVKLKHVQQYIIRFDRAFCIIVITAQLNLKL